MPAPEIESLAYRWNELPADAPMPLLSRRRIIGEQAMLSQVTLQKGCAVPAHSHANEQFCCVLSGRLRFGLGKQGTAEYREVDIAAGAVLHLPAHLPHAALALEETVVLDIFSPPSATTGIDRAP
jgi:quercetin dioxygenase-like cupin family protein